jgi:hypothetical protein
MSDFRIVTGACRPLFCFEVGFSIDLDAAERAAGGGARAALQHRERPAGPFEFRPAPLRLSEPLGNVQIPPFALGPAVELTLYDFGAASVSYSIPLDATPEEMLALSIALRGHADLVADARRRVTRRVEALGSAIQRPKVAERMEDYFIFEITELAGRPHGSRVTAEHAAWLARVLRAEKDEQAEEEIADAVEARISFSPGDVTLVDWDSAIIIDPEPDDLRAVLEYANVQLLELRYLDESLDDILDRSYHLLSRRSHWASLRPNLLAGDLRRVSTLQIDSSVLLERVTNALKFLSEEYLARLYRLTADRLHLGDWGGAISRKIQTVESIYQAMSNRSSTRRMEVLEWVVIILFVTEIVLALRG